jgi:hypothetical protein
MADYSSISSPSLVFRIVEREGGMVGLAAGERSTTKQGSIAVWQIQSTCG